eukprot:74211-Chlamydomonas_euryale.AAC.1
MSLVQGVRLTVFEGGAADPLRCMYVLLPLPGQKLHVVGAPLPSGRSAGTPVRTMPAVASGWAGVRGPKGASAAASRCGGCVQAAELEGVSS